LRNSASRDRAASSVLNTPREIAKSELGIFLHDIEVFDAELLEFGGFLVLPLADCAGAA